MTALQKIKSFFKRPKAKAKAEQPKAPEAAEKKVSEPPEKKAGESNQQSSGTT